MVNGFLDFGAATFDLALDERYPLLKLVDRQMINVLPDESIHRIVGALGEKIVWLHRHSVDPDGAHVNNR
jgi:hypothetical protein